MIGNDDFAYLLPWSKMLPKYPVPIPFIQTRKNMRNFQRLVVVFGLLLIAAGCPEMMEDKPQANAPQPPKAPQPAPPPAAPPASAAGNGGVAEADAQPDMIRLKPSANIAGEGVAEDGSEPVEEIDPKEFAKEQAAASELEKLGAFVVREGPEKQVTSASFMNNKGKKIDKKTAEFLSNLFRVMTINLADTNLDGECLKVLKKNRKLVSLVLSGTPVGDKDMAYIAEMPSLVSLFLTNTNLTDAGLAHLAKLPRLAILEASGTKITDRGLPEIAKLQNLNWLLLSGTEITDVGLPSLAAMPNLRRLTLADTKVTEEGIAALKASKPGLTVDSGTRSMPNGQ
jgi:hypothetical protein